MKQIFKSNIYADEFSKKKDCNQCVTTVSLEETTQNLHCLPTPFKWGVKLRAGGPRVNCLNKLKDPIFLPRKFITL